MSSPDSSHYYISRKGRLLKDFRKIMKFVRPILLTRYDDAIRQDLEANALVEYEALIPALPYVGKNRTFTQFVTSTAQFLVLYRILQRHGIPLDEVGKLIYAITKAYLESFPRWALRLLGGINFSSNQLRRIRKLALESQKKPYPMGYVFDFIEGDGHTFDYGIYYHECASCKFLQQQGAFELTKYICTADIHYSNMFHWGLQRTTTLAEGQDRCDFRFKKGGATRVRLPDGFEAP